MNPEEELQVEIALCLTKGPSVLEIAALEKRDEQIAKLEIIFTPNPNLFVDMAILAQASKLPKPL